MALAVVDSLDKVAEPLRSEYEQKDGKYVLKVEGQLPGFVAATELTAANARVVEFRDKNIALLQEVEPLRVIKTQFEGIDPVAAKEAITQVAELGKKGVKKVDDLQVAIEAALKPIKEQLEASKAQTAEHAKRADESLFRNAVSEKFTKAGGKVKALDFVVGKAASVFEVKDGQVVAKANQFSAAKPGDALGLEEWLTTQARENDFAFEPSTGSGANPAKGGNGGSGLKPGQTVLRDPTPKQLGEAASDIKAGKVKIEYSQQ
jgi:hypothetical protein